MGQCRTLDADVTIGCGDYSSCDNTIPIFGTIFFHIFLSFIACSLKIAGQLILHRVV